MLVGTDASVTSTAALRTAEGALERLPVLQTANLAQTLQWLQTSGAAVASLDVRGDVPLPKLRLPKAKLRVLVAGAEETGLTPDVASVSGVRVRIPGSRSVESLNVGAAVAIALAHLAGAS